MTANDAQSIFTEWLGCETESGRTEIAERYNGLLQKDRTALLLGRNVTALGARCATALTKGCVSNPNRLKEYDFLAHADAAAEAGVPYVGMPASVVYVTDSSAAVVIKVNAKSVVVAKVATGEAVKVDEINGWPVYDEPGLLDQPITPGERYKFAGINSSGQRVYANGTIRLSLGRSVDRTDYGY
jgi:hypothetical protein